MFTCRMLVVLRHAAATVLLLALHAVWPSPTVHGQNFTNVAAAQGLTPMLHSTWGSSVSFHDFDNDGWDDLTFAVRNDSVRMYRNVQGSLQRIPSPIPTFGQTKHVLWVDVDNDGDDDLFLTTFDGACSLWRNNGASGFEDVTAAAGLPLWNAPHFAASFGDYDRDGYLDLYVCTYIFGVAETYPLLNHLYRNNGDGTFTDVTLAAGVGNGIRFSFQSVWFDYDLDGWPDLYVINDRNPENTLYRNNGDGTFTDVTESSGTGFPFEEPMSVTIGDLDNDGDLDIFMSNSGNLNVPPRPCILLVNNGDGTFTDRAPQLNLNCNYYGWGATWIDLRNDTRLDLIVASNFSSITQVHRQNEDGLFQSPLLLQEATPNHSWCVSTGDLNNDGYADVVASVSEGLPPELWVQESMQNQWIKITPRGTVSNRNAIGTWVKVHVGNTTYSRYTTCGANLMGQDSQHVIFGLGEAAVVDSVSVTYLSGHRDVYYGLDMNEHHYVVEGETYPVMLLASGPKTFCEGDSIQLDAGEHLNYLWNTGHTGRYLTVSTSGTFAVQVGGPFGIQGHSDTLYVVVHPLPEVLVELASITCADSTNGAIALSDLTGLPPTSVNWDTGDIGDLITGLGPGNYGYTYSDVNGCTSQGNVLLVAPPELICMAETAAEINGGDGAIFLAVFGGTPPYSVLLNGSPDSLVVQGLSAGTYTITILDQNGCSTNLEVTIRDATGIVEWGTTTLLIPNPAYDEVRLNTQQRVRSVIMRSINGQQVRSWSSPIPELLSLRGLDAAVYHLELRFEDGTSSRATLMKWP